jgi:hypothetical protein
VKHQPITDDALRVDPIRILMPECTDPEERDLRQRLLTARNVASKSFARKHICVHARELALILGEAAAGWVFAPASADDLRAALDHCRLLMKAIVSAEALEDRA